MGLNELQICITSVCEIECSHCHLDLQGDHMSDETFKRSVEVAKKNGIDHIRLTGGTVFEHPNLVSYLEILKENNMKIIVNYSILSIEKGYEIAKYCDYVLISIYHSKQLVEYEDKLKKLKSIRGDKLFLMGCTVYQPSWNNQLKELTDKVDLFDKFFFLRDTTKTNRSYYKSVNLLIEKLSTFTRKIQLANGFPMCMISRKNLDLCAGSRFDNGTERLYVKPDGVIKPSAYTDIELCNINDKDLDLIKVWKKHTGKLDNTLKNINTCQRCKIKNYCRNGITTLGKKYQEDPLFKYALHNNYQTDLQKELKEKIFKIKKLDDLKILYHEHSTFYMQYPPTNYWKEIEQKKLFSMFELKDKRLNLYVHFPFCTVACSFCNIKKFNVITRDLHIKRILEEAKIHEDIIRNNNIYAVYFGGGSPQLLGKEGAEILFEKIFPMFRNKPTEVNFEMFPRDYDEDLLNYLTKYVTRVSMGIQCLDQENLRKLHRHITIPEMVDYVSKVKALNFKEMNLDIIYGLFMNKPEKFEADIRAILAMGPTHVTYQPLHFTRELKYDEGDNIGNQIELNTLGRKILAEHGFHQNSSEDFSIGDKLHYQEAVLGQENLLALGEHTYGVMGDICYNNYKEVYYYHVMSDTDKMFARLFMKLRFLELDIDKLDEDYGISFRAEFSDSLKFVLRLKYVEFDGGILRITEIGKDYVDLICNILSLSNLDYKLIN